MPTKFVILSAARSGTSLLTSTLHTHPDILCHGEIFHPKFRQHLKGTFDAMSDPEILVLREDTDAFVARVYDQPGAPIVGFKMWEPQHPECCARLLADTSVRKIIYERSNKLAQFSSGQLAKQTGVWNVAADNTKRKIEADPLPFNPEAFARFLEKQQATFRMYRAQARGPVLDIGFEQIAEGDFSPVLAFLGAQDMELAPRMKRLHSSDILSRYDAAQHDTIRATLRDLDRMAWVFE